MTIKHRPYNGIKDFLVMTAILAIGRKTTKRPYYVHVGDLSWWMFYDDHEETYWPNHICIWERDGLPIGWSLFDTDWCSFDVYLLPELRGTKAETYILDWTIQRVTEIVQEAGGRQICTAWVSEHDEDRIGQLKKRGFVQNDDFMWYLERPLNDHIPDFFAPVDFTIRSIRGEEDICQRASASHRAFGSSKHFEEYQLRYQRFMRSPVYNPNFDLVTEASDGQFASFCIIWPDPVNHIGLFEPVGTHPSYQRRGLGRAVVTEGLRQLQAWGMNRAMVCAEHDNPAAMQMYRAVGFEQQYKLYTYIRSI